MGLLSIGSGIVCGEICLGANGMGAGQSRAASYYGRGP